MKTFALSALLTLTASIAQAAPVTCTTNIAHDPRQGSTEISISSHGGQTVVTQVTQGGMAHFVTAPKKFDVSVAHEGPEVVVYTNSEEGFELTVGYQPIGGEIRGTLITEVFGQRIDVPVSCVAAQN
jgi:hypothetical protein